MACKSRKAPDDVIPEKKMINLLTQVHVVDGMMYAVSQAPDSLYKYGMARYLSLFKRFDTDSTQFKRSMQFYTAKPEILDEMYDQVILNLQTQTDSLNKIRTDSISKARKNIKK